MVMTFLALMKDPKSGLSDSERILVLQALFRPAGSKDDPEGMPASLFEAVVKSLPGKS